MAENALEEMGKGIIPVEIRKLNALGHNNAKFMCITCSVQDSCPRANIEPYCTIDFSSDLDNLTPETLEAATADLIRSQIIALRRLSYELSLLGIKEERSLKLLDNITKSLQRLVQSGFLRKEMEKPDTAPSVSKKSILETLIKK